MLLVAAADKRELLAWLQADSLMTAGIQAEPLSLKLRALRWRGESPKSAQSTGIGVGSCRTRVTCDLQTPVRSCCSETAGVAS